MVKGKMDHFGVGLVCALLLLIQYGNGAELNITSPDPPPSVQTGDTINLTISYNSTPNLIIWTFNGNIVAVWIDGEQSITANYKDRLTLEEKHIYISGSTLADSGDYLVAVNDKSGNTGDFLFKVAVNVRVPEIQSNDTGVYKTGENISLTISYAWVPLSIVWYYNGSPVIVRVNGHFFVDDRFKGRVNITDNGSLIVYNTTNADAGMYTVTVPSNSSSASRPFQVKFYDVISSVTVQQTPAIVIESTPMVNLFCRASSGSGSVTWQKNGQPLSNDSSHVLLDQTLQILNPDRTFSGNYSCNMSNPVSWHVGSKVMTVYYPVVNVKVTQSPAIVGEYTSLVELNCSASSGYIESVTWTKEEGTPITNNGNYILSDGNKILKIMQPNRTFTGLYICNISNAVYWSTGSLKLLVYEPVENVKVTQSPKILDGNSIAVNLSCNASSKYIEAVTWTKDGKSIEESDTFTLLDGNHTLRIIDPNRTFSGHYSCDVSNAAYRNTSSLQLHIYDPVENVTVTQSLKIVSENSLAVNLSCGASSGYIETVTWTKAGTLININNNYNFSNENRILQINKPNRTFNGLYICNMSNAAYWKSGSLELLVYDPVLNVQVTQSPEKVTDKTPLVTLSCSASSGYTEKVTWTKDGKTVVTENAYSLSEGNKVLQITKPDVKFSGIYTCNISNAAYWKSEDVNLKVSGATPGAASTFGMMIITLLGGLLLAH